MTLLGSAYAAHGCPPRSSFFNRALEPLGETEPKVPAHRTGPHDQFTLGRGQSVQGLLRLGRLPRLRPYMPPWKSSEELGGETLGSARGSPHPDATEWLDKPRRAEQSTAPKANASAAAKTGDTSPRGRRFEQGRLRAARPGPPGPHHAHLPASTPRDGRYGGELVQLPTAATRQQHGRRAKDELLQHTVCGAGGTSSSSTPALTRRRPPPDGLQPAPAPHHILPDGSSGPE